MLLLDQEREEVLFRNEKILVTSFHLEIGTTTYSMRSVKNVWAERADPSILVPLASLLLGFGVLCWGLTGPEETMWMSLLGGGGVLGFGL